ncbi:MAG: PaaI family thioesterase [Candidatus Eremiobacteraeota bacterium]|nr:PaaI family thioesterase [Candidatus Eremiobacteraeota bacterium]
MQTMLSAIDPAWEERVRTSFAKQGAMQLLRAHISELWPGRCTIELPFRADLAQQHGYFHAGVTSAVADSAGGYAALSLFPPQSEVLTVEFKINLIAPANGDRLVADANVVRTGRTLTITTVDVSVERDGARIPCALMQQTLIRIEPKER